ncbi:hypothetical protein XA68_15604 [Ophiocordyceps unilateralis]|uniref:Uncharacterized protein n=1 Tax=Ophiocordyceps unilateralis TaxID=268505 RepID=A0A2A9P823_OPHUN|nr:hypothetical protein XA68_15604 [Ophiocordyceps unilateralis]
MADDKDKALRDRLQALRDSRTAPPTTIVAAETGSREDALAARLKLLRHQHDASHVVRPPPPPLVEGDTDDEAADALLRTDDDTLEHLLGSEEDDDEDEDEEGVQALLRELSVRDDQADAPSLSQRDEQSADEQGPARVNAKSPAPDSDPDSDSLRLVPSLPPDLAPLPPAPRPGDDMATRLAALRRDHPDTSLPSVPSTQPSFSSAGPRRLTSRYGYTDDDVDSWCTVCLEDATLRCLGCDDDPYCSRCWNEMHRGPAAAFDDRSHKAVQFTGRTEHEGKNVALGAY